MFPISLLTSPVSTLADQPLLRDNFTISSIPEFISSAIGWGLIIGAVIVFGCLVISGFQLATGGNDSSKTKQSKDNITNCLFGFGVLASTYAIALVVQSFLGINTFQRAATPPNSVPENGECFSYIDCQTGLACINGTCQYPDSTACNASCIALNFSSGSCTTTPTNNNGSGICPDPFRCWCDGAIPTPTPIPPTPTPTPTTNDLCAPCAGKGGYGCPHPNIPNEFICIFNPWDPEYTPACQVCEP